MCLDHCDDLGLFAPPEVDKLGDTYAFLAPATSPASDTRLSNILSPICSSNNQHPYPLHLCCHSFVDWHLFKYKTVAYFPALLYNLAHTPA